MVVFTHFEILIEEPSAEAALELLLPKILCGRATFRLHPFEGKSDLLGKLESRLRGYASWRPKETCVIVLVDRDDENCQNLKARLESAAAKVGLSTRTSRNNRGEFSVVNRILVEELEAWFFGDVAALVAAYPGISATLGQKAKYRDPDAIDGGTWEALERLLQARGYHGGGLAKIQAARDIAKHMNPLCNRSKSFQIFRAAICECINH